MLSPNEITFNSALIAEMRAIDFVKRLLAEGKLDPARYKDVLMHRIDGEEVLNGYSASSIQITQDYLDDLRVPVVAHRPTSHPQSE